MSITINSLREDTQYFVLKQISSIVLISIMVTLIIGIIESWIKPNMYIMSIMENHQFNRFNSMIDFIHAMNMQEKQELFKYLLFQCFKLLTNKTLLIGSIITFISILSTEKKKPVPLCSILKLLPNLFLLNCLTALCVQLGFFFLIIPGILLSILLSLAPIIICFKQHNIINSIVLSSKICWKYITIVSTGIIFWICTKYIFTLTLSQFIFFNKSFSLLMLNIGINILYSILIIYLCRFYILVNASKNI